MKRIATMLIVLSFFWLAGSAQGRTWYITPDGSGDAPTIQTGITAAGTGDIVLLAPGTYTGVGNRDIDFLGKAITVTSESGQDVTIIDCQGLGRGFYFHSGEGAGSVLKGVMVTKGYALAGGGIYSTNSSLTLTNCTFARNTATETGGGMICLDSSPRFIGCTFSDNEALGEGGGGISAIPMPRPRLQIADSLVI
jgi:hypothetical protein